MADRRTWGKRLVVGGGVVVGVGLLLYLIGGGRGRNGGQAPKRRCVVKMRRAGTFLDEEPTTADEVIAKCNRVDLTVSGAVIFGDFEDFRNALEAAGIDLRIERPSSLPPSAP